METGHDPDVEAIRRVIATQFESMDWEPGRAADWAAFTATVVPEAILIPAARPAKRQTVEAFIERMKGLEADGKLRSFSEKTLGIRVQVFGNVAVALGACEMLENGTEITRDVSGFLLIKDDGVWRIVAQAWDLVSDTKPLPPELQV
jgi:hypothetical protein